MLAGQFVAVPDQADQSLVIDRNFMFGATLATKFEHHPPATDKAHVAVTQGGQAIARIGPSVFSVTNAKPRRIENADHDRKYLVPRQFFHRKIDPEATTETRQRISERQHALEFRAVARGSPLEMVAVLFSTSGIATRRLQVTARICADPDVLVSGRDGEASDSQQDFRIADRAIVRTHIRET